MWRSGLTFALLLCLGLNGHLFGCSCAGPQRSCENLRSDAVFAGRVVETVPVRHQADKENSWYYGYSMRFAVDEAFRGSLGTEVTIETGSGGGDCGTPLHAGDKYLIFAYRNAEGELWTDRCSGNERLTDNPEAGNILEVFRSLAKKDTATIFGAVWQTKVGWRNHDIGDALPPQPMKKLLLHAVSDGYSTFTHTTEKGTFEFQGLPPGKYKIEPELPGGLDFDHEYPEHYEAEVFGGACAEISFRLLPVTRIRGHLILPPGAPDRVIEVIALPVQLRKVNEFSGKYTFTDEEDRFDLWPLPAGDYYVGVNINNSPKEDAPFPPTYYPGVTSQEAHIIHLEEGQIKELELPLPEMAVPRTVKFVAIGLDGKPMKHIYIQREDLRHPGDAASYVNVDLDKNGAGSMIVYAGYSYHLHGSQWLSYLNEWCAKPVVISAGTEPVNVRFVMNRKSENCNMVEIDRTRK